MQGESDFFSFFDVLGRESLRKYFLDQKKEALNTKTSLWQPLGSPTETSMMLRLVS